jgi:serine/threonine-protein kinase RsbW
MVGTPMAGAPNVRLRLSNRAENVLLVRQTLSGLAETIGLDAIALNDVSTAVTEACNNVVLHAYGGAEGPMEVDLGLVADGLDVMVRDSGLGILPDLHAVEQEASGIGLPVIRALTERVEFRDRGGRGTEVAMHFELTHTIPLEPPSSEDTTELAAGDPQSPGDVTMLTVAPTAIARTVIPRVLSTLAARAYFSTDRISDTQLLADALVAHTSGSISSSHLSVGITVAPRTMELRIGPLRSGMASELVEDAHVDGLGQMLDRLADEHKISALGSADAEMLNLRLAQHG